MNFEQTKTILSRKNFNDGDLISGIDTVDRGAAGRCALRTDAGWSIGSEMWRASTRARTNQTGKGTSK
jgi:hypothetical protein